MTREYRIEARFDEVAYTSRVVSTILSNITLILIDFGR